MESIRKILSLWFYYFSSAEEFVSIGLISVENWEKWPMVQHLKHSPYLNWFALPPPPPHSPRLLYYPIKSKTMRWGRWGVQLQPQLSILCSRLYVRGWYGCAWDYPPASLGSAACHQFYQFGLFLADTALQGWLGGHLPVEFGVGKTLDFRGFDTLVNMAHLFRKVIDHHGQSYIIGLDLVLLPSSWRLIPPAHQSEEAFYLIILRLADTLHDSRWTSLWRVTSICTLCPGSMNPRSGLRR